MPRAAHRANQQAVGSFVVDEPFAFRIPHEFALQSSRDIAQMAEGIDPDRCVDAGDGPGPALDAVQEIPDVVIALAEPDIVGADP